MRIILLTSLTILSIGTFGQAFTLDEIIQARSMDSSQFKRLCVDKGLKKKLENWDDNTYSLTYCSRTDRNNCIIRTFSQHDSESGMIYYYFNEEEFKGLKEQLRKSKFRFSRSHEDFIGKVKWRGDIFLRRKDEVDLSYEKIKGEKAQYCLLYYDRM